MPTICSAKDCRPFHGLKSIASSSLGFTPQALCRRLLRRLKTDLPGALTDLLGAEASNAVQTEAEDQAILFSQTHVKARKLCRHCAAVPAMTECHCRAD